MEGLQAGRQSTCVPLLFLQVRHPLQKETRFATNSALQGIRMLCKCLQRECFGRLFGLRPLFPLLLCIVSIRKSGWGICISATSLVFWFGCLSPFEYASNPTCWLYSEQEIVFWLRSILNWFISIAKDRAFELHRPHAEGKNATWTCEIERIQPFAWHAMNKSGRALSAWLETPFTSSDRVKAGWLHKDKLNSGCCVRVGEAANPAPGRSSKATWQRDTLESTPLLLPVTIALEERRLLQAFLSWCQTEVRAIALEELFNKVPEGLALLLWCYGDMTFQTGGALSNLRHLLLAAQRWKPSLRTFMQLSWDGFKMGGPRTSQAPCSSTRSRCQSDVYICVHLVGLPLVWAGFSNCSVFLWWWLSGWNTELLQRRPSATVRLSGRWICWYVPVFLRLRFFNSKFRNPAHVQHLQISDTTTCILLHLVFRNLDKTAALFDTNPRC